jgi:type II secretory pathway pseudopilin PulG
MGNRSSEHNSSRSASALEAALKREQDTVRTQSDRIRDLERENERLQKELDDMKAQKERLQQAEQAIRASMKSLADAHCALTGESYTSSNSSLWSWITSLFGKDTARGPPVVTSAAHSNAASISLQRETEPKWKQKPPATHSAVHSNADEFNGPVVSERVAAGPMEGTSRPTGGGTAVHSSSQQKSSLRDSNTTFSAEAPSTPSPSTFHVRIICQGVLEVLAKSLGQKLDEVLQVLYAPSSRFLCEIVLQNGVSVCYGNVTVANGSVRRIELDAFQFGAGFVTEVGRILMPIKEGKNVLVLHSDGRSESKPRLDENIRQFFKDGVEAFDYNKNPDKDDPIFRNTFSATFHLLAPGVRLDHATVEELARLLYARLSAS